MGQCPHVLGTTSALRAEHRPEPVTGIIGPQFQGHGPLQHGADTLPEGLGEDRLGVPDGLEDLQHVGARHLGDGPRADAWEDVAFEAPPPVPNVPRITPALPHLVPDAFGGDGEGGHALGAAAVGQWVAALAGELAVSQGLLAGLGERDQTEAAESDIAPPAADHQALDPAAGAGRLDHEVESVPVTVPSDRGGAHERGRKALVGMLSAGL